MFEGPLDLLLHLVRKHELDILDIPISFVAEKYLAYLDVMRQLDLEIAGDYLVMAATLAYLKSRELLPPEPRSGEAGQSEEEEGEDPREALIRRLVEYERFKQAAAELDSLPVSGRDVFARGAELVMPPIDPGLAPVSLFNLAEAYYRVLTRAKVKSTHEVQIEAVTVAQRIKQLALILDEKPHFEFEELFLNRTWNSERELRAMLVVTLMSILEMVKLGVAGCSSRKTPRRSGSTAARRPRRRSRRWPITTRTRASARRSRRTARRSVRRRAPEAPDRGRARRGRRGGAARRGAGVGARARGAGRRLRRRGRGRGGERSRERVRRRAAPGATAQPKREPDRPAGCLRGQGRGVRRRAGRTAGDRRREQRRGAARARGAAVGPAFERDGRVGGERG
ncbi:segregation and condensation protein A [Nannocystis pusilla]|uniref:segregation and condensation protein A n=1 Tax=Nannocystis pusilla TaxID=889268 RepID=UPI003B7FFFB8